VTDLHGQGISEARLYGDDESVYGGLNAFFLLMDEPEAYRLPNAANAVLPSRKNLAGYLTALITAVLAVFGALIALRRRREPAPVTGEAAAGAGPDRGTPPEARGGTAAAAPGGTSAGTQGGTSAEAPGGTPPEATGGDE
jgi:hypothetical protein